MFPQDTRSNSLERLLLFRSGRGCNNNDQQSYQRLTQTSELARFGLLRILCELGSRA